MKKQPKFSKEYLAYISSDEWREKRKVALGRAGHRCQTCAARKHLDVHHNTYARFEKEDAEDLVVLCRACHDTFHNRHSELGSRLILERRKAIRKLAEDDRLSKQASYFSAHSVPPPISLTGEMVVLTDEILNSAMTKNGGYTKECLDLLGVKNPPCKGWRSNLIGKLIDRSRMDAAIAAAQRSNARPICDGCGRRRNLSAYIGESRVCQFCTNPYIASFNKKRNESSSDVLVRMSLQRKFKEQQLKEIRAESRRLR